MSRRGRSASRAAGDRRRRRSGNPVAPRPRHHSARRAGQRPPCAKRDVRSLHGLQRSIGRVLQGRDSAPRSSDGSRRSCPLVARSFIMPRLQRRLFFGRSAGRARPRLRLPRRSGGAGGRRLPQDSPGPSILSTARPCCFRPAVRPSRRPRAAQFSYESAAAS